MVTYALGICSVFKFEGDYCRLQMITYLSSEISNGKVSSNAECKEEIKYSRLDAGETSGI